VPREFYLDETHFFSLFLNTLPCHPKCLCGSLFNVNKTQMKLPLTGLMRRQSSINQSPYHLLLGPCCTGAPVTLATNAKLSTRPLTALTCLPSVHRPDTNLSIVALFIIVMWDRSSHMALLMLHGLTCLSFLRISFSWIPIVIDVFFDRLLSVSKLPEYQRRIHFR